MTGSKAIAPLLHDAAARAARYLDELDGRDVRASPPAVERLARALADGLPDGPTAAQDVLAFLDEFGSPATVANAGGRYFGFVTGGALPATLGANILAGGWDQNCFSFVSSPAVALFEAAALRWLKEVLGLPVASGGAFVTGATMANFTCLAAARDEVLRRVGWEIDSKGLFGAPDITVIVGQEVHATTHKVLSMLGLGRDRVVRVPVDDQGRMRPDGIPPLAGPTILCLQAGNVNSGAFDLASAIIPTARRGGAWVHVDGAFGLWALASPDQLHLAQGFEDADSWAADAHKWLNVPYDCGVAFVREPETLSRAMSISGAYLMPSAERDAIDFTPDSSRRARAVEVWAALKSLGRFGLAEIVGRNCRQAQRMADGLRAAGVDVMNEVVLNQVVAAFGGDDGTKRVIAAVQEAGVCWCGGTMWRGRSAMRISISSWATTDHDIDISLEAILDAYRAS